MAHIGSPETARRSIGDVVRYLGKHEARIVRIFDNFGGPQEYGVEFTSHGKVYRDKCSHLDLTDPEVQARPACGHVDCALVTAPGSTGSTLIRDCRIDAHGQVIR